MVTGQLSRISKLFVDRDGMTVDEARAHRAACGIALVCGRDVSESYGLQTAVITAAGLAARCFPGAVRVVLDSRVASSPLRLWPTRRVTLGEALAATVGAEQLVVDGGGDGRGGVVGLVFGDAEFNGRALRVTFDGWIATTGPVAKVERLGERDHCPLAGVLAASLAVSEVFMEFAGISVEATRRAVGLSLWRPDVDIRKPGAQGVEVKYLPRELWVLGLGHLGSAYLWALAALRYCCTGDVEVFLTDFDRVGWENLETSMLFTDASRGRFKTRVCSDWLEGRGFKTRLVERRLDERFVCGSAEPRLALCGFDDNAARRCLETAAFGRVVESGLGARADNFDALAMHTLPNRRAAAEIWPDPSHEEEDARAERLAAQGRGYSMLGGNLCGRVDLAGVSVSVPFVGTTAASLVLAEVLRVFHGGPACTDLRLRLAAPSKVEGQVAGRYTSDDLALPYVGADGES